MYWPDDTSEPQVAKFIMTSVMVGVPAFGPSLIYSPQSTLDMMKAWLGFYRANKIDIATGRFSPFGQLQMPNHKIEGQGATYAYFRNLDFSEFVANNPMVYLLNATDADTIRARVRVPAGSSSYRLTVLNRFLVPEPGPMTLISTDNVVSVDVNVEQGGMAILAPRAERSVSPPQHFTNPTP
jgi:hypothetical protein